jgi:benzylsuccinate CoA-transferase BbsF subunit
MPEPPGQTEARRSADPPRPGGAPPQPLAGIRVVELSQGIAGPTCGRHLAAHGAEVIKVESRDKLDINRQYSASWLPATVERDLRIDTSPLLDEFLSDKLSAGIDIATDDGRELLYRLVACSDVFVVNLSVHAVSSLRLRYEDLRAVREDLIYVSLPAFGESDTPYRDYRAWGPNLAPLAGIDHLTGWPDRPPSGISSFAYPDYLNAGHATVAVLGAMLRRDLSGLGQRVDFSQYESCVGVLGPVVMDYVANGRVQSRAGNRSADGAPHGVYPARGDDRWVAIACQCDDHWSALCEVAGDQPFARDQRWSTTDARREGADELDAQIAAWTGPQTAREVAYRLQERGVPAGMVQDNPAMLCDPQLEARDFYTVAPRSRFGVGMHMRYPPRLSGTPARHVRAGVSFAEDNDYVLGELVGVDETRRRELVESGVVQEQADPEARFRRPYVSWLRYFTPTLRWPEEGDG